MVDDHQVQIADLRYQILVLQEKLDNECKDSLLRDNILNQKLQLLTAAIARQQPRRLLLSGDN